MPSCHRSMFRVTQHAILFRSDVLGDASGPPISQHFRYGIAPTRPWQEVRAREYREEQVAAKVVVDRPVAEPLLFCVACRVNFALPGKCLFCFAWLARRKHVFIVNCVTSNLESYSHAPWSAAVGGPRRSPRRARRRPRCSLRKRPAAGGRRPAAKAPLPASW